MTHPRGPVPHVTRGAPPRSRLGRIVEGPLAALTLLVLPIAAVATALASRMTMAVGTRIRRDVRSGTGQPLRVTSSQAFMVVLSDRGRTDRAIACDSGQDYAREFGDNVSYGFGTPQIAELFANGATRVHVVRKVGAAATKGTLNLKDRSGSGGVNTLRIDAISAGAWSANLTVQVDNGTIADTATVTLIRDQGTTSERREQFANHATVAALAADINGRSQWATATDLGLTGTAYPTRLPVAVAATALSAGADDRAAVNTAAILAGLTLFPPELGPGCVIIPGYHGSDIGSGVAAHCADTGRVAYVGGDTADSLSDAIADVIALQAVRGSENVRWVHGWIRVADPDGIGTVLVPPVGAAAGVRARAHETEGPHRIPAGDDYPLFGLEAPPNGSALSVELTQAQVDQANENNIVPIIKRGNRYMLYGDRSLSADQQNFYHGVKADTLNSLAWDVAQAVQTGPFSGPIDARGVLARRLDSRARAVCQRYADANALYPRIVDGDELDPGYSVTVTAYPDEHRVEVVVAARVSESAELVDVTTILVPVTASV